MKKILSILIIIFFSYFTLTKPAEAITDPLAVANNKIGIHILDPNEVDRVADLVNGHGGEWGYVTVPIRDDDRDRLKWEKFMEKCRQDKLIPIVRLATVMKPGGWESPTLYRSLDFANFLNELPWPVRNRYIIVYNEPNHSSEWEGKIDPSSYAKILKYTAQIFKSRNENFFILGAGLDSAAPDDHNHMSIYNFLQQMAVAEPDVFEYLDGWASHSYPNPAFSGSPNDDHYRSIVSYRYETEFISQFTAKKLPVFITETGWDDAQVGQNNASEFLKLAIKDVWNDPQIVSVTPFLLQAGAGPFTSFSFLDSNGQPKPVYLAVKDLAKQSGHPELSQISKFAQVLAAADQPSGPAASPTSSFSLPVAKWEKILSWFVLY